VKDISEYLGLPDPWRLELAAMLSQTGCVVIPRETLEKINSGQFVSAKEQQIFDIHPRIAQDLLSKIPRLEKVAQIIGRQQMPLSEGKPTQDMSKWDPIDLGGQVLRTVIDYDRKIMSGMSEKKALSQMREMNDAYLPSLLDAMEVAIEANHDQKIYQLMIKDLQAGHILAKDIYTISGICIIKKGIELTESTIALLLPFAENGYIKEPVYVK
jgi:response regulator RpfG family c-di-GMP phosphodiesterase